MSQNLDIRSDNSCPANRTSFFGNYQNKENFVKALARYLMDKFKVIERPSDADTTIVKEALMGWLQKNQLLLYFQMTMISYVCWFTMLQPILYYTISF